MGTAVSFHLVGCHMKGQSSKSGNENASRSDSKERMDSALSDRKDLDKASGNQSKYQETPRQCWAELRNQFALSRLEMVENEDMIKRTQNICENPSIFLGGELIYFLLAPWYVFLLSNWNGSLSACEKNVSSCISIGFALGL